MIEESHLNLSSHDKLEGLEKQKCPQCDKMRMYFCYDCKVCLPGVFTPIIQLPACVDIIKHPMEKNSKSSALHCKIVAPTQTRVFDVPDVYDYRQETSSEEGATVVVFPSPDAVSIDDFVKKNGKIKRFVVLDCTWFQVGQMQKIPEIQGLPKVKLESYRTAFWRPQKKFNDKHLATIEAIYFALREYQSLQEEIPKNNLDDLLFWFFFIRHKVEEKQEEYRRKFANREISQ